MSQKPRRAARTLRFGAAQLSALVTLRLPEMASGFLPAVPADRLAMLEQFIGQHATTPERAAEALRAALGAAEELALLTPDQSWKAVRERLQLRLDAARQLWDGVLAYLPHTQRSEGRERSVLMRTASALERLRAGGDPPTQAVIRANADPAFFEETEPLATALLHALPEQIATLEHAIAAITAAIAGHRPPGGPLHIFAELIGRAWQTATGEPPGVTRGMVELDAADGGHHATTGRFAEFCALALACNPNAASQYGHLLEGAIRRGPSMRGATTAKPRIRKATKGVSKRAPFAA